MVHDGLAAVVSTTTCADFHRMSRQEAVQYLVAHQRVVETVIQDFTILPAKFGTILPSETRVHMLLEQGKSLFRKALAILAQQLQMEVVILWDQQQIFAEMSNEPEIIQRKTRIEGRPPAETMAERVELGKLVHKFLEQRRTRLQERIVASVRDLARDVVVNPVMDESMVANLALLIDRSSRSELERRLEALDGELEGKLHFRCIGPLPPYSFATVEVEVPTFELVDASRRLLGLADTATRDEIKQAYRRLAGQMHPDYNPNDPEAEKRMAEVTRAYRLLTRYAETQALWHTENDLCHTTDDSANQATARCDFSQEAVGRTLILAVRRQEVTP